MRLPLLICALSLVVACNPDAGLTVHDNNRAPEVTLLAPAGGEQFFEGAAVEFQARVQDDATALEDLELAWHTTNGGSLVGNEVRLDGTVTFTASGLAAGEHTASLTAIDAQGASARQEVVFTVAANRPPAVGFLDPEPDGRYATGAVPVVVSVADDRDAPGDLLLTWGDAAAGLAGLPTTPDDAGEASFAIPGLAEGPHRVSVTATDASGATRTVAVDFEVVDPDGDHDGHVAIDLGGDDCDDEVGAVHPGADEVCDGVDNDCDTAVDEAAVDASTWYFDDDLDGYGDPDVTQVACAAPGVKWKAVAGDCDDTTNARFPTNPEVCDGLDNDCASGADNGLTFTTYYTDGDGDTWGKIGTGTSACAAPPDSATRGGDCDDTKGLVNPDQAEVCNGVDDDCANGADDGLTFTTYYYDSDLDGYGDPGTTQSACAAPGGKWRTQGGDCDDTTNARFPTNPEVCDGIDNDCASGADNGLVFTTYYTDGDGDTWGKIGTGTSACAAPADSATRGGDCEDGDNLVNPDRPEVCNGKDDDCSGGPDDGLAFSTWYYDFDLDGYGDPGITDLRCDTPSGTWVDTAGDCNDDDSNVNPLETEICNGKDDDCANGADDADPNVDLATADTWYGDADGDTWGVSGTTTLACAEPDGYAGRTGDCLDGNALVNPGQAEVCGNGLDDDCFGGIDDGCDVDHSGTWKLYKPGTNTPLSVSYSCDGWSFSFNTVSIVDTWPDIVVTAVGTGTIRVNGCEPGWELFCTDTDGMTGTYDASSVTDWWAWDSIEPLFGSGYAEIYEWVDSSGTPGSYATFTDDTTFVGRFAWSFEPRSTAVPADCVAGSVAVEGRKQ